MPRRGRNSKLAAAVDRGMHLDPSQRIFFRGLPFMTSTEFPDFWTPTTPSHYPTHPTYQYLNQHFQYTLCKHPRSSTEMRFILCTWFVEFCSCCSLTALPGPAWVLLNWICKELISSLYTRLLFEYPLPSICGRHIYMPPTPNTFPVAVCNVQRGDKFFANPVKQDPGRARQSS